MKIISFISPKGGVGKTTLAIHLATQAEQDGKRVVILDLDPQASACMWADIWEDDETYEMVVDSLQPARLDKTISRLKNDFDLCIIDTAGLDDATVRVASEISDITIIPTRASILDLSSILSKYKILESDHIYTVLNALPTRGTLIEETEKVLKNSDMHILMNITQRQDFAKSIALGLTAYDMNKNSKAAKEQQELYTRVKQIIFSIY